ncbi:MAG: HpcH/HpaI aldolase/citrate lyase family protein [Halobacteriota archaeon]
MAIPSPQNRDRRYPRRTLLYTPADRRERMENVPTYDADGVVFDLDDSVPDDRLPAARRNIREVTRDVDFEMEVIVKLDAYETNLWVDDLETALESEVDAVAMPKIEHPKEVQTVVDLMERYDGPTPELLLYIETPEAVVRLNDIAETARRLDPVTGMVCSWGDDITRNMGTMPPRFGDTSVGQHLGDWLSNYVALAATGAGLDPISYPHVDIDDQEGLRTRAEYARDSGYVGQLALHPAQLEIINDAFTPKEDDVARAVRLAEEFDAMDSDAALIDGVFVDQAMAVHYRQFIARYEEITGDDAASLID